MGGVNDDDRIVRVPQDAFVAVARRLRPSSRLDCPMSFSTLNHGIFAVVCDHPRLNFDEDLSLLPALPSTAMGTPLTPMRAIGSGRAPGFVPLELCIPAPGVAPQLSLCTPGPVLKSARLVPLRQR